MSTIKMVPISGKLAGDLIILLGELQAYPAFRFRAADLCKTLGEAATIAGEHRSDFEMMCCELIGAANAATGRQIETVATWHNVKAAREALAHTAPVLGNVIALPRTPEIEITKAIRAASVQALADMPGPIDLRPFVEWPESEHYQELTPVAAWAVPERYTSWCGYRVIAVEWDSPKSVRLILAANSTEDVPF